MKEFFQLSLNGALMPFSRGFTAKNTGNPGSCDFAAASWMAAHTLEPASDQTCH
jgi:hypothetical protein